MSFWNYLSSDLLCFFSFSLVFGLPWLLLFNRFPEIPRTITLLSVFGFYCFLFYLKPENFSIYCIPTVGITTCLFLNKKRNTQIKKFFLPINSLPVLLILFYCFLAFLLRWEPTGDDPIKWGSLSRLIIEHGKVPGDTRPLTALSNLKGATLGLPILIALSSFKLMVPLERLINFFECLSLALFIFSLSQILKIWFSEKTSQWTSLLALTLFSVPQTYLNWGGTPTLMGMTAGLTLLSLRRSYSQIESILLFSFAIAYGAYAHPIGFYISMWVCLPVFFTISFLRKTFSKLLLVGIISFLFFAPFFLYFDFNLNPSDKLFTWIWQKEMAGTLFRTEHTWFYNMYIYLTSIFWNTSAVIAISLCLITFFSRNNNKLMGPLLVSFGMTLFLSNNVLNWKLPLSYLLYPERCALFLILPLTIGIGNSLEYLLNKGSKRKQFFFYLFIFSTFSLSVRQFSVRLYPQLFNSQMTPTDLVAFHKIEKEVPLNDCIAIEPSSIGKWIPVLSFRCTIPFHGLGMNSVSDEKAQQKKASFQFKKGVLTELRQ